MNSNLFVNPFSSDAYRTHNTLIAGMLSNSMLHTRWYGGV